MLVDLLMLMIVKGLVWTTMAFMIDRANTATSILSMATWIVVYYSSSSIKHVDDQGSLNIATTSEPVLSALALGLVLFSLVALVSSLINEAQPGGNDKHTETETWGR